MPGRIEKISVLMPVYNGAAYIRQSINSILQQSFKDFEFIIVDDGSTDGTDKAIKEFTDSRIQYYRIEHAGTSAALNYGVTKCRHDWIARIDADDVNTLLRLEKQAKYLEDSPETDILSAWSAYFTDPGKIIFVLRDPQEHEDITEALILHNPVNQSAMICRKRILEENKFNESLANNEDFELMFRLKDKYRFHILPEVLVYTRWRKDSRTFATDNSNIYDMLYLDAFRKMQDSKSKGVHFYWASKIAWINYFYGDRRDSRGYFRNSFSLKNLAAYITTFLPNKYFFKFTGSRFRYRFRNIFENTSAFSAELKKLLVKN
ncbi:MAG: glycosyltransferase [Ignavibacteria bacterium]|nr:glycosyltransferase [Ignavibacteria bacterium]